MNVTIWPDTPLWEKTAAACPAATFYHTPLWHTAVSRAMPEHSPATRQFSFPGGTTAILPCFATVTRKHFRRRTRLKSSLFGAYGGLIANLPLSPEQRTRIADYLHGLQSPLSLTTSPFGAPEPIPGLELSETFTQVRHLPRAPAALQAGLTRGGKNNLRQACNKGVRVYCADDPAHVDSFCEIYRDTLARWGEETLFTYPEALFAELLATETDHVRLWLAEHEGRPIAGAIVLYWNHVATYWHGAALQSHFSCYPNNLLHMEIMRQAIADGYDVYDFGPSGGRQGVVRFKKSFGAETAPYSFGRLRP